MEVWAGTELGLRLRWWQRLALRRVFEHDDAGDLCWRTVLASTPRRAGKSTLVLCAAAHRLTHGDRLGERDQLLLHIANDRQSVAELMRAAWPWAERSGHTVRRANGSESIEAGGSRWLLRAAGATYGYPVGMGIVDEAWGVDAEAVDDGIEPAQLHRPNPQLWLTSTAHRRATSLMRRRLQAAVSGIGEDWSTLVILWAAAPDAPVGEVATWRSASPHWTAQQEQLIAARWARVQLGEADPAADDPDPIEGFKAQYLNIWPSADPPLRARERPAIPAEVWAAAEAARPHGPPLAAAVESYFGEGTAVALAWAPVGDVDRRHVVSVTAVPSVAAGVAFALDVGVTRLAVGKSLTNDAAVHGTHELLVIPKTATGSSAVAALRRAVDDGMLAHDGSAALTGQVTDLRVTDGVDGPRLRPGSRCHAVKAAVWAYEVALDAVEPPAIF